MSDKETKNLIGFERKEAEEIKSLDDAMKPQINTEIIEEVSVGYEKTSKSFKANSGVKSPVPLILNYFKRNWIFLTVILFIWIITGVDGINILPSWIAGPLRYCSSVYNGPVGSLSVYTFLVAVTAKSAYIFAMTDIVLPSIVELFREKNPLASYKNSYAKLKGLFNNIHKKPFLLGLTVACAGLAMAFANLLTRNGKIDKSFILILLIFTLFKGMSKRLSSVLYIILKKLTGIFIVMLPGGIKNTSYLYTAFSGLMSGLLIAIIVGNFGEYAGYFTGAVFIIAGIVIMQINKVKN